VYAVNDTFDRSGMVVWGTDSTGQQTDITDECTPGNYDFSTPGSKTITITHTPSGKKASFNVTVMAVTIPAYTMVSVSGGTVTADIGDDGAFYDAGTTPVSVSAFKIGETEITWELWKAVYDWATDSARGAGKYIFANSGSQGYGTTTNQHPVTEISWRDAVVWCNAYSEAMGKTPVYKYAGAVLRESEDYGTGFGYGKAENAIIDSTADGFRLPTEAEWEFAARGGPDAGSWTYTYAGCNTVTALENYAWYSVNSSDSTHVVKTRNANILGLYDMSGNVWEWCGDIDYYPFVIAKGGGSFDDASYCDIGDAEYFFPGWDWDDVTEDFLSSRGLYFDVGFRVACNP
jgi:formylglycine-generating enzyme required for sulfatase activity